MILFFKLGSAPFHSWYISIALQLPIVNLVWLLTVQKLIPFKIISMTFCEKTFSWLIAGSIVIRVGYLIIQSKFAKILIASSIVSNNWVLAGILGGSRTLWQKYFFVYRVLISLLVYTWGGQGLETIVFFTDRSLRSNWRLITILILRGFPPGPIFLIKITIIQSLAGQSFRFCGLTLLIGSAVRFLAIVNIVVLIQMGVGQSLFKTPLKLTSWGNIYMVNLLRGLWLFRSPFEL